MKNKIAIIIGWTMMLMSVYSQNTRSMYFLDNWSQRHEMNASFAPENGYFAFPVFGGSEFYISSNTGLSNFIYPYNNEFVTFLHPSVDGHDFVDNLKGDSYLNQNSSVNLISFGLFSKNAFWTFGYKLRENLNINLPLDLFRLIKLGFEHQTNQFDLKNLSFNQNNWFEYSLGYSRDINPKLRVGAKLNLLSGISSEKINYSQFDLTLANDHYEVNATGESTIMSDVLTFKTDENNNFNFADYNVNLASQKPSGAGLTVNLGVTFKPLANLSLSAAINDYGVMSWNSKTIQKGIAKSNLIFSGFTAVNIDSIDIESQFNQLEQDANKLILFQKQYQPDLNILEFIPGNINVSAEYSIFNNKEKDILIGLLFNNYNSGFYHETELTGAVTIKPILDFCISGTYAFLRNDNNRFGLAVNYSPKWVNIYFATDYLTNHFNPQYLPINPFAINIKAGITFFLGYDQ